MLLFWCQTEAEKSVSREGLSSEHRISPEVTAQPLDCWEDPGACTYGADDGCNMFSTSRAVRAAIVSCGGLCPGENDVIHALVNKLAVGYGVPDGALSRPASCCGFVAPVLLSSRRC